MSLVTVIVTVTVSPIFIVALGMLTLLITGLLASIRSAFWLIAVVKAVFALPALSFNTTLTGMSDPAPTSVPPLVTEKLAV